MAHNEIKENSGLCHAPIILENYNPLWPEQFEAETARLLSIAGTWQISAIESIGSTAVPGMLAKSLIDKVFDVQTLEASKVNKRPFVPKVLA